MIKERLVKFIKKRDEDEMVSIADIIDGYLMALSYSYRYIAISDFKLILPRLRV